MPALCYDFTEAKIVCLAIPWDITIIGDEIHGRFASSCHLQVGFEKFYLAAWLSEYIVID